MSPVHVNAAFAGTVAYPNITANYRLQWPSFANAYRTYALSYDQYLPEHRIGIGGTLISDDQAEGTLKQTKLRGLFSYNIDFGEGYRIKFGVGAGLVRHSLDWDRLIFFDQIDPQFGFVDGAGNTINSNEPRPPSTSGTYFDLDMGMLIYNPKWYAGVSIFHANGPYNGYLTDTGGTLRSLPVLLSLHAGYQIVIQKDNKGKATTFISPNLLYATQCGFHQLNLGAFLQKDVVFGGLWMRHTIENIDSWIGSVGVHVKGMRIAYSYDLTSSNLGIGSTGGSHEIGISMGLSRFEKKVSKLNDCLSLFR